MKLVIQLGVGFGLGCKLSQQRLWII